MSKINKSEVQSVVAAFIGVVAGVIIFIPFAKYILIPIFIFLMR